MALGFELHSAGVLAPGVSSLAELLAWRSKGPPELADTLVLPSPAVLPANERRRASQVVRLVLACAAQALAAGRYAPDELCCVFASDEGTGEVCQAMLEALVTSGQLSPLLFHNSVHNAPAGYFSIAYQNHLPAVSVSMGSESFAAGLLCAASEASTSAQPVLFVAYDAPLPEPMRTLLPIGQATASAWIIESDPEAAGKQAAAGSAVRQSLGRFELSLHAGSACAEPAPSWLPAAWAANSSARAFEVLGLLANGRGSCEFPLGAQRLRVALLEGTVAC